MKPLNKAIRFLLVFFISYAFLMLPQTGLNNIYARFFSFTGSKLFHYFDTNGIAVVEVQKGKDNINLMVSNTAFIKADSIGWYRFSRSSDHMGYWHTIFLLSLIIATPLSWKKKMMAIVAGFFLITCVVMLRLRSVIIYCCAITPEIGLYQTPSEKEYAFFWNTYFGTAYSFFYSVSILIWLMVCIGKKEWRQLNNILTGQISGNQKTKEKVLKKRK